MEQLVDAGLLTKTRTSDGAPGRPAWRYQPAAPEPAPGPYRILVKALLDHLAAGGTRAATRAGQEWGRHLAAALGPVQGPLDAVLRVLRELGFDPKREPASPQAVIHLRQCPFLDLVDGPAATMCRLHAGVIEGIVQASGGRGAGMAVEPLGAPTACVVRLGSPGERRDGTQRDGTPP